jgi:aminocarboxymuconate-semialdehyde decarboxylase
VRIDVHGHFLPPRFFDEMERLGAFDRVESFSVYGPMLGRAAAVQYQNGEQAFIDGLVHQMDESDIDVTVLGIGALQPYFDDPKAGADAARFANDMLADAVELGGGRIAAFASIPLPNTSAAIDEADARLSSGAFAGINFGCSVAQRPLDDPAFDEVWSLLSDHEATVFLHPGTTPNMAVGSADYHLAPDFCSPAEIAVAMCRLVVSRLLARHRGIDFIAGAMGGSIPYLARRFDRGLLQSHPELYEELGGVLGQLKRFWYDTSMIEDAQALDVFRNSIGVDRLVFGSDVPRGPLQDAVRFISDSDRLTPSEKARVFDQGARQLKGLGALGESRKTTAPADGARARA